MAKEVLKGCGLYLDEFELSRALNRIDIEGEGEVADVTTFGADSREFMKGMIAATFSAAGFLNPEQTDDPIFAEWQRTTSDAVLSALVKNQTGGVAYFFRGCIAEYGWGMPFGGAATATLGGRTAQPPFVRGKCLLRSALATSSGNGTGIQFPAVLSTQSIHAALHVFHADGTTPTLAVKIQSDDNSGFTSATDRLTFATASDVTSEWKSAGPAAITDTYWRVNYTIGGSGPEFGFAVVFGIAT